MQTSSDAANGNEPLSRLFSNTAEPWDRHFPMTKDEAERVLTRDLPAEMKVSLKVKAGGSGNISITGASVSESRSFDLESHVINSGWFEITGDALKGQGLGRRIMRNEIEFFRACGVKKFNIFAALENGGYTWARLGFLPDGTDIAGFRSDVKDRYKKLEPLLSEEEKNTLRDIVEFKDARDSWRLADAEIDLAPRFREIFKQAAGGDWDARRKREVIQGLNYSIERDLAKDKPLNVGRLLMTGTNWHGNMDFDNEEQMKRVETYVGGWRSAPRAALPAAAKL